MRRWKLRDGDVLTAKILAADLHPNADSGVLQLVLHVEPTAWPGERFTVYAPSSAGRDLEAAGACCYRDKQGVTTYKLQHAPALWRIRRTTRLAVALVPAGSSEQ